MSLDVYLQTFKCLSSLDAGILWLGLIGQCTNIEFLTFNSIREKINISLIKPTLRSVKCTGTYSVSLMLANFEVKFPELAPIHTFFIRFSFLHFNWHNTPSISRAVRLKNDETSRTHCSLSAILDLLLLGTGTSLPYLGAIRQSDGKAKYIVYDLLFRNVLRNSVSLVRYSEKFYPTWAAVEEGTSSCSF